VVVRRWSDEQVEYRKRQFGTTRSEIQHVEAWLRAQGVSEVGVHGEKLIWIRR